MCFSELGQWSVSSTGQVISKFLVPQFAGYFWRSDSFELFQTLDKLHSNPLVLLIDSADNRRTLKADGSLLAGEIWRQEQSKKRTVIHLKRTAVPGFEKSAAWTQVLGHGID